MKRLRSRTTGGFVSSAAAMAGKRPYDLSGLRSRADEGLLAGGPELPYLILDGTIIAPAGEKGER
jgi:hypothetical protein